MSRRRAPPRRTRRRPEPRRPSPTRRRDAALHRARTARRARRLAIVLLAGAIALVAIGFTQFRLLRQRGSAGIAMLALDVSESMSRADVEPSRLEAAADAARAFLDGLPADLSVGLASFSGTARTLVPPSTDRDPL